MWLGKPLEAGMHYLLHSGSPKGRGIGEPLHYFLKEDSGCPSVKDLARSLNPRLLLPGLLMQFGSATFHTASSESITNVHSAASPTGSATECYDIMMSCMQWLSSHPKSDPQVRLLKQKCGGRRGLDVDIYSWPGFPVRGGRLPLLL